MEDATRDIQLIVAVLVNTAIGFTLRAGWRYQLEKERFRAKQRT